MGEEVEEPLEEGTLRELLKEFLTDLLRKGAEERRGGVSGLKF